MSDDREMWMAQAEAAGISPDVAARRWEERMRRLGKAGEGKPQAEEPGAEDGGKADD